MTLTRLLCLTVGVVLAVLPFTSSLETCAVLLNEPTNGSEFDVGLACNTYCTKVAEPPFDGSIEYVDPTTPSPNRTHPDAICKCVLEDQAFDRVVCRDGNA